MLHIPGVSTAWHGSRAVAGAATCGVAGSPSYHGSRAVHSAAADVAFLASTALLYAICQTSVVQPHFQRAVTSLKSLDAFKQLSTMVEKNAWLSAGTQRFGDLMTYATSSTRNIAITAGTLLGAALVGQAAARLTIPHQPQ